MSPDTDTMFCPYCGEGAETIDGGWRCPYCGCGFTVDVPPFDRTGCESSHPEFFSQTIQE